MIRSAPNPDRALLERALSPSLFLSSRRCARDECANDDRGASTFERSIRSLAFVRRDRIDRARRSATIGARELTRQRTSRSASLVEDSTTHESFGVPCRRLDNARVVGRPLSRTRQRTSRWASLVEDARNTTDHARDGSHRIVPGDRTIRFGSNGAEWNGHSHSLTHANSPWRANEGTRARCARCAIVLANARAR